MNIIPGGPFLDDQPTSQEVVDALKNKYGLDKPLIVQYKNYLFDVFRLNFGVSYKLQRNRPVILIIKEMMPVSIKLGFVALLWSATVGLILGCIAAYKQNSFLDNLIRVINTFGVALPNFVTATVLLVVFAGGVFHLFPSFGLFGWKSYVLPCFTLGFSPMCHITRYTKSAMLDELNQDYITTAQAKGLSAINILFKHALRNVLIVVVTYIGHIAAFLLTGSLVVETVFNIPGLGRYFMQSIFARDYPLIMGTTISLSVLIVAINFLIDILYKFVDPRISF
jgi:oligopeptide transport system permease protein